jgi:hypothetical protein
VLIAIAVLALHWRPSRQVRLHQEHLLETAGARNWKKVERFLAPDYKDRWGQSRADVLQRLPQAFQDFLACSVEQDPAELAWNGDTAVVRARIRILGSGGAITRFVMAEVNGLREPFALSWRKQSWKPWDWALVAVDQPEIDVPVGDLNDL